MGSTTALMYVTEACILAAVYCGLYGICRGFSLLEEAIRIPPRAIIYKRLGWSLPFFKTGRNCVLFCAAVECAVCCYWDAQLFLVGTLLVAAGVFLRLSAIRTLGDLWTNHVCRMDCHTRVRTGIYGTLKHPGYLGNMFLPGLALCAGAPMSSVIAAVLEIGRAHV